MAAPFCPHEQEKIRAALLDAAMRHACRDGMKHTSVDQLTAEVSISKGEFYRFFSSKELLFLNMLEEWYRHIAELSARVYEENKALAPAQRGALMFRTAIGHMLGRPLTRFIRDEVPVLLRRLPPEALSSHYTSIDDFILSLIRQARIPLLIEEPVAVAIIKTLIMSILYSEEIGPHYEQALELTIQSVCTQLVGA